MFLICVRVWACSKSKQQHFVHVCQEVGAELGFFVLFFSLIQCETKFERKQGRQEKTLSARFNHQREKSLHTVRITTRLLNHVHSFSLCGRGQGVGVCC